MNNLPEPRGSMEENPHVYDKSEQVIRIASLESVDQIPILNSAKAPMPPGIFFQRC